MLISALTRKNCIQIACNEVINKSSKALFALAVLGVNSIDIKNLGPVFRPVFGPILPVSICLPGPANLPIFNLTSRANFRALIYVN